MTKNQLVGLFLFCICFPILGLANSSTGFDFPLKRYVYNESDTGGISVDMKNNNDNDYLMEAWIANADNETLLPIEKKETDIVPFIILPPLKQMMVGSQVSWNVRRIGAQINGINMPQDRESLFWIGIRGIPSEEKIKEENRVQLNIIPNFYFKLLYRPKKIEGLKTRDLTKQVKLTRENQTLTIENPTPFYLTFDYLTVAGNAIKNGERQITLIPFSTKKITLPSQKAGVIEWRFTDEYLIELNKNSLN
ncbi:molecular chaperone [Providencia sneebia]|uniref:Fimbrial chaperone n=1 Tax=Providencia sneebia DSM 19967 TaxID=1141660 RepID=K8WLL9_9GAMM|nr:molecular chaperone [Providencia sneebia]EKT60856.1 fimbrial chaperone [Providencia sneebia DSM 19967]